MAQVKSTVLAKSTVLHALAEFKEMLGKRFGNDDKVYLFGSYARAQPHPDSDVDVLVLIEGGVTTSIEEKVFDIAYEVELKYELVLGVIVYSSAFWKSSLAEQLPLHASIAREGILI